MTSRTLPISTVGFLWVVVMAAALYARPHLPVDETRYLAVAWEMWQRGDFLVPYLNGEPYSHKPPLLFWLMQAGWGIFGVNDWWPRFVAPLFGLGSLFLTCLLAKDLWPDEDKPAATAPFLLMGSLFWVAFASLTMFDMLLAFCTLVSLLGLQRVWSEGGLFGWMIFGFGIGLGVLAKGPAILVHTLPVAMLAPYWDVDGRVKVIEGSWRRWYLGIFIGVLIGAAIGLAWAIPAAIFGGEEYRNAIFIKQTAGRMVKSFAHRQPWWFFLALIGPMLLPWTLWPRFWRSLRGLIGEHGDRGVRFCLAWFLPALLVFSMISGKQPHYLLPEFPALALLFAYLLNVSRDGGSRPWGGALPALFLIIIGAIMVAAPLIPHDKIPAWVAEQNGWWGLAVIVAALWAGTSRQIDRITSFAIAMAVLLAAGHMLLKPRFDGYYSVATQGQALAALEASGKTLLHYEKYHGQYQFAGRLTAPIRSIPDTKQVEWATKYQNSKIITYREKLYDDEPKPDLVLPFRDLLMVVWDRQQILDRPKLAARR